MILNVLKELLKILTFTVVRKNNVLEVFKLDETIEEINNAMKDK